MGTLLAVASLGLPAVADAAPAGPVDLGTLPGDQFSDVAAINAAGVIIGGGSDGHGGQVSLRWDRNGRSVTLAPLPGGGQTDATGITADGSLISGIAYDAAAHPHAVRWNAAGVVTDLSPGYAEATVSAISDAGVITGTVTETGQARPVAWGRDGRLVRLGWPAPPSYAQPRAINSAGVVVGTGALEFAQDRAVRWVHGTATVLEGGRRSEAVDAAGTAVGNVESVAARWGADGTETSLGTLPGGDAGRATGIARDGTIVGKSDTADAWHAVYWPAS
ncbi:hypothetical protein VA596_05450 [Amycolatopsis sp., V23-08]|uniref:HAF repeat-containing protein n=1 Tax=Amycolatopsis heterodermiae TaxID=3110235 RepID=A0ABU5QYG4_9PSEU|nr:hypothetical protein [Amycolatopsis sp., V23-08]MEA5358972.1 hypothetical protein [Amycolatopsis sp., V23-08]